MKLTLWLASLACLVCLGACATSSALPVQTRSFVFEGWGGPAIMVHTAEPEGLDGDARVVFVLHGVGRNGEEYRDNWIDLARRHGLRVYVPEFSRASFPGAEAYNLGSEPRGEDDPPGAYDAIEPLFDHIRETRGVSAGTYVIFGHSAGAQYVHRFACFVDAPRFDLAIAANAGWYTLPDAEAEWPYGLKGVESSCDAQRWLERPLVLLLGDADTDPQDRSLRRTPEADAQGPHRFARGQFFHAQAAAVAAHRNWTFNWRIGTVRGVAHDNAAMARAAAGWIAAEDEK